MSCEDKREGNSESAGEEKSDVKGEQEKKS